MIEIGPWPSSALTAWLYRSQTIAPQANVSNLMSDLLKLSASFLLIVLLNGCMNDPSKRTFGVFIDDAVLEPMIRSEIKNSDPGYKGSHLAIVSYNGVVLLAGQVANEALRTNASEQAQSLQRVRKVHNELTVGGPISLVARSNDSWLTTKVKTRLLASDAAYGTKVKVVTENGVIYMLGLITRDQADTAVLVASNVFGVQKIVKVFEYLD
jgi:osmotically-inducible protein OsmY